MFDDFDKVSSKAWKQKIQLDLKGADYNKTLIWNSPEGIDIKPFYHPDEFETTSNVVDTRATSWKIAQAIYVKDAEGANKKALELVERGVESIVFTIPSSDISIKTLTKGIDPARTPIHLEMQFLSDDFVREIMNLKSSEGIFSISISLVIWLAPETGTLI